MPLIIIHYYLLVPGSAYNTSENNHMCTGPTQFSLMYNFRAYKFRNVYSICIILTYDRITINLSTKFISRQ